MGLLVVSNNEETVELWQADDSCEGGKDGSRNRCGLVLELACVSCQSRALYGDLLHPRLHPQYGFLLWSPGTYARLTTCVD